MKQSNLFKMLILIGSAFSVTISCNQKRTFKSRNFSTEITTWGFTGPTFEVFLYNTDINTYSLQRKDSKSPLDANTLYVLVHDFKGAQKITDSLKISLTEEQVDSLYDLAYQYLSKFEINNEVEEGKIYERIMDGSNLSVSLNYDGKLMQCSQYRLKSIISASTEAETLIEFINSKTAKGFRIY